MHGMSVSVDQMPQHMVFFRYAFVGGLDGCPSLFSYSTGL
jgi:hypothetical protein